MNNALIREPGDEIRVIAPSMSREPEDTPRNLRIQKILEKQGYKISFGKRIDEQYQLGTAMPESRAADLHEAFADKNVRLVMAHSGGWSANEMLPHIDWGLLRANPKPFIGYSDVTVLLNAIYVKTGQLAYLGPCFGTFDETESRQYTIDYFMKAVSHRMPLELLPSKSWKILQEGDADGIILGGNFNTFHLLQGTQFQPVFDSPFILAAEDDDESGSLTARYFSRRLESILQLPQARQNLRGMIIGRFLPKSDFSTDTLADIIQSKQLHGIPVIAEMDFGHTMPMLTLPIGGRLRISAHDNVPHITIM